MKKVARLPRIRTATDRDIDAIAGLHAESWRTTYRGQYRDAFLDGPVFDDRLREWRERFASARPNQYVIVANDGPVLAGFACAFSQDDE